MGGPKLSDVVKGARPVHHGQVSLVLEEAFDEMPTFLNIADHLSIHPDALLFADVLTVHPDAPTEATRQLFRITLAVGTDKARFQDTVDLPNDLLIKSLLRQYERDKQYALPDRPAYPHWPVPLRDHLDNPTIVVATMTDSLTDFVENYPDHIDPAHGWYGPMTESFDDLRDYCWEISLAARTAIKYARWSKSWVDGVVPQLNDMVAVLADMLAFETPYEEKPSWYNKTQNQENFSRLHKRLANVALLSSLISRLWLEESTHARWRDTYLQNSTSC